MVRRTTPARITDDARYRFRIKFDGPTGELSNELRNRLDAALGRNAYAVHPVRWDFSKSRQPLALHCNSLSGIADILAWWDSFERKPLW